MPTALRLTEHEHARALPLKVRLTDAAVAKLTGPTDGSDRRWVYDAALPGLVVMVTNRRKVWYIYKRIAGPPRRIRLGEFPALNTTQARQAARVQIGAIATGRDLAAEKASARTAQTKFSEVFEDYLATYARARKRTAWIDECYYRVHLADWHGRRIGSITKADARRLHAEIGAKKPTTANRLAALIHRIWSWAEEPYGLRENVGKGIEKFPEVSRERFLRADELGPFFQALEQEHQDWQDFFGLLLWTGCRSGNLKSMKWEDVSLEGRQWTIPAAVFKSNKTHVVPLGPPAMEILERRARNRLPDVPWVFPASGDRGHIIDARKAWTRIMGRCKLPNLKPHDLRRSIASWMVAGGTSLHIVGGALGHRQASTSAVYARLDLSPIRTAMDAAGAAIQAAAKTSKQKGGNKPA